MERSECESEKLKHWVSGWLSSTTGGNGCKQAGERENNLDPSGFARVTAGSAHHPACPMEV